MPDWAEHRERWRANGRSGALQHVDLAHERPGSDASELAYVAGVAVATASGHLRQLLDGGLLAVEKQGRHRYYRLARPEVASAIEALMDLAE